MKDCCPYWDLRRHDCMMTGAGVFIPLPDHIDAFCRTLEFASCKHFRRSCELQRARAEERGILFTDGRRRYPRLPSRVSVALAAANGNGQGQILADQAHTVDLSIGGMRVETPTSLPAEKMVLFTFGEGFARPAFQGLGQIRWADRVPDGTFQAGVAFLDYQTSQAVSQHLGLAS
ncbi:MAG: PilZ domain-containing protein [Thermodesulfobacteriota bacterium]